MARLHLFPLGADHKDADDDAEDEDDDDLGELHGPVRCSPPTSAKPLMPPPAPFQPLALHSGLGHAHPPLLPYPFTPPSTSPASPASSQSTSLRSSLRSITPEHCPEQTLISEVGMMLQQI